MKWEVPVRGDPLYVFVIEGVYRRMSQTWHMKQLESQADYKHPIVRYPDSGIEPPTDRPDNCREIHDILHDCGTGRTPCRRIHSVVKVKSGSLFCET